MESFARYEFKYALPSVDVIRISDDIRHFMDHDLYVRGKKKSSYLVRSLYFDNQRYTNFFEKIDGVKKRHKYRIRTYSSKRMPDVPVFVERKERNNNRVEKFRERVRPDSLCLAGRDYSWKYFCDEYENVAHQFGVEILKKGLIPKVVVQYQRTPFVSYHDGQFRVTLDSELVGIASNTLWDNLDQCCRWASLLPNLTIMEVKFNRRIPAWFHRIIQANGLERLSISKYVLGVKRLGLAKDLS